KLSTVRQIIVRPTTAIRRYMTLEQDAVAAGRELGVDLVLEGSIQRDGERVRVTARLMNVEDGAPVWAYRCDEVCTDIFELQDTISADVVQALMLKLTSEQKGLLAKRSTSSADAYQYYVQGRYAWNKRTDESLRKSIQDFQRAVEIDPGYALAYAGLADSYIVLGSWTSSSIAPKEALLNAKAAATKALEIDNTLAEAHASLADVGLLYEWDWEAVEREFEVALDLNPYYATAHQWYGNYLAAMGRLDESIAETRLAQTLDPLSPIISGALGARLYLARRYDEAIEQFRKTLDKDPDFAYAHASLARAYEQKAVYAEAVSEMRRAAALSEQNTLMLAGLAQAYAVGGNVAQATKILEKLETQSKQRYVSCYELAIIYVALGKQDQAFGWLEKAYGERASYLIFLKVDPRLDSIRCDRRFSNLLRRMELL